MNDKKAVYRSTLERGNEIEADFYSLKAQEWAMEFPQAKALIEAAMEVIYKARASR